MAHPSSLSLKSLRSEPRCPIEATFRRVMVLHFVNLEDVVPFRR